MSEFSSPFDMNTAPVEAVLAKTAAPLPKGLKAICIIAIILGSLGILLSIVSGVGLVLGPAISSAISPQQPGLDPGMREAQEKMQQEIQAVAQEYTALSAVTVVMHLLTAILLLAGGIMTLKRNHKGTVILTIGCVLAIVYEVGQGMLNAVIQLQTVPIVKSFAQDAFARAGQGQAAPEALEVMPQIMVALVFVGLAFSVAVILAKCIFYLISIFYLRKPQVTSLFRQPDSPFV